MIKISTVRGLLVKDLLKHLNAITCAGFFSFGIIVRDVQDRIMIQLKVLKYVCLRATFISRRKESYILPSDRYTRNFSP